MLLSAVDKIAVWNLPALMFNENSGGTVLLHIWLIKLLLVVIVFADRRQIHQTENQCSIATLPEKI